MQMIKGLPIKERFVSWVYMTIWPPWGENSRERLYSSTILTALGSGKMPLHLTLRPSWMTAAVVESPRRKREMGSEDPLILAAPGADDVGASCSCATRDMHRPSSMQQRNKLLNLSRTWILGIGTTMQQQALSSSLQSLKVMSALTQDSIKSHFLLCSW